MKCLRGQNGYKTKEGRGREGFQWWWWLWALAGPRFVMIARLLGRRSSSHLCVLPCAPFFSPWSLLPIFFNQTCLLYPLFMHHDDWWIDDQRPSRPHEFLTISNFLSASSNLIFRTDLFLSAFWTTNYASDSAVLAAASNNEASALCHGCFVTGPDTIRIAILTPKAIRPWTMNEALTWSTTVQKKKGLDLNFSAAFISFSFLLLLLWLCLDEWKRGRKSHISHFSTL